MMHINTIRVAFIVFATLVLVIGCSDASADEAVTYLPADQPCSVLDESPTHPEIPGDETTSADGNTDLQRLFEDHPRSEFLHFTDNRPTITPAADDGDDTPILPVADEELASLDFDSGTDDDRSANSSDDTVNINDADADELMELSGIGPALADRIIEYRQQRAFEEPGHLRRIEGIGSATYDRIASEISVD